MERVNSVLDEKSPPGDDRAGGPKRASSAATRCQDLASALLRALQARLRVQRVYEAAEAISARAAAGEPEITPDEVGEYLGVYREGFEVLCATWPPAVRDNLDALTGICFDEFFGSLERVGEALYEAVPGGGDIVMMITPDIFAGEARDD